MASLWADLAGEDTGRAYQAVCTLTRKPQAAVALLKGKLHPAPALEARRIAQWIKELDDDAFDVREKATQELAKLGDAAEGALHHALAGQNSPEARQRIEKLLERRDKVGLPPEYLRASRAVEVLEQIGTPEAKQVLEILAAGGTGARLTEDAKAALRRLAMRATVTPLP